MIVVSGRSQNLHRSSVFAAAEPHGAADAGIVFTSVSVFFIVFSGSRAADLCVSRLESLCNRTRQKLSVSWRNRLREFSVFHPVDAHRLAPHLKFTLIVRVAVDADDTRERTAAAVVERAEPGRLPPMLA